MHSIRKAVIGNGEGHGEGHGLLSLHSTQADLHLLLFMFKTSITGLKHIKLFIEAAYYSCQFENMLN